MTREQQIAAEVAAKYRCRVMPDAVKIIPRGVSAFATGELEVGNWKDQRAVAWAKACQNRARMNRVMKARAGQVVAENPALGQAQDMASRALPQKQPVKQTRAQQAERHARRLIEVQALRKAGKTPEESAATMGCSVWQAKCLATAAGCSFPAVKVETVSANGAQAAVAAKEARRDALVEMGWHRAQPLQI